MSDRKAIVFCKIFFFVVLLPSILLLMCSDPQTNKSNRTDASGYPYTQNYDYSSNETVSTSRWEISKYPPITFPTTSDSADVPPSSAGTTQTLRFVYWPETVRRNEEASVRICGKPNTEYKITVMYSSGKSTAAGLVPRYSNTDGYVTWFWHVGGRTNPGTFTITVTGGGETKTVKFKVVL